MLRKHPSNIEKTVKLEPRPMLEMGEIRATPGVLAAVQKYKLKLGALIESHARGTCNSNDKWDHGRYEFGVRRGLDVHSVFKLKPLKKALTTVQNIFGFAQMASAA